MQTREQWLVAALQALRPAFAAVGASIPETRVSIGFPSRNALSRRNRTIGQCWDKAITSDAHYHVFVSPVLSDGVDVLAVLVHELVHAVVGTEYGHKAPFRRLAIAMGLEGKMTSTVPSEALRERLNALLSDLGPFPSGSIDVTTLPKQTTRLIKASCPACGAIIRLSKAVIEDPGLPYCACTPPENDSGPSRFEVDS